MNGQPPAARAGPAERPARPAAPPTSGQARLDRPLAGAHSGRPGGARRRGHGGRQGRGHHADQDPPKAATESTMDPYWGRQTFQYKTEEPAVPPEEKKPVDTTASRAGRPAPPDDGAAAGAGGAEKPQDDDHRGQAGGQRGAAPAGGPRAHAVHFACGAERRRRRAEWRAGLRVGTRDLPAVRGRDEDE